MIRTPEIKGFTERLPLPSEINTVRSIGRITKLVGLTLESRGPAASVGDLVSIRDSGSSLAETFAEVVGFRDNRMLLLPLEGADQVRNDQSVHLVNEGYRIGVGPQLLGRVIDGLGRPIDGKGPITTELRWKINRPAPDSMARTRIKERFSTGIRAIDAALPCGRGQRLGVFAGSGVGKSMLIGMICRNCDSDVNVIALTGERGKEVRDFLEGPLGEEGLAKSVVIVTTSDKLPLQRVKAAEMAMSVAEYFREQGKHVLFIMESLTRYAYAQREIGLSIGEPPATKGYPPSVFARLPRLLERAGTDRQGSITGFFTVLADGDDMSDPIADTVRSIVDGHIVLSRDIAGRGHYPAIDILSSVSRVTNDVADREEIALARELRTLLSVYRDAEDMINIGAYKAGTNPEIDRAVKTKAAIDQFLRQDWDERTGWPETRARLQELLA